MEIILTLKRQATPVLHQYYEAMAEWSKTQITKFQGNLSAVKAMFDGLITNYNTHKITDGVQLISIVSVVALCHLFLVAMVVLTRASRQRRPRKLPSSSSSSSSAKKKAQLGPEKDALKVLMW